MNDFGQTNFLDALFEPGWACSTMQDASGDFENLWYKLRRDVSTPCGKYPQIDISLVRKGDFVVYAFGYMTGCENNFYGCGHPCYERDEFHSAHRQNSRDFIAEWIGRTFEQDILHDPNLTKKSRAELLKKFSTMTDKIKEALA